MNLFASESRSIMQVRTALFGLVCCLAMSACEASKADLTWVEPVKLASGETVKIKRHVVMIRQRAWGGGFSSAPIYRTSSIELEPSSAAFPKWDAPVVPLILDKDLVNGEWLVIASADSCGFWRRNGKPALPYWTFRLRNGEWFRTATPESVVGRLANLLVEFDVKDSSRALSNNIVTLKSKQRDEPRHARHFSKIDGSPKQFYEGCGNPNAEPAGLKYLDLRNFRSLP